MIEYFLKSFLEIKYNLIILYHNFKNYIGHLYKYPEKNYSVKKIPRYQQCNWKT